MTKPWITKALRKSIKRKNELFFFQGDTEKYRYYRNKVLQLSRISKKNFYHSYFEQNMCNMKKTWEGINLLINRKRKSDRPISSIRRPNNQGVSCSNIEVTNISNEHFASVGEKLASKIPHSSVHFSNYLP